MIIVEGPDGSGKTTLAKKLADKFGLDYRRHDSVSSVEGPLGDSIISWWNEQIFENSPTAIYDRCFYVSELMYQPIMVGRRLIAGTHKMIGGIADLWQCEPQMIFCLPPWSTSEHIVLAQNQKLKNVTRDGIAKVHWGYSAMYQLWANSLFEAVTRYDFTTDPEAEGPIFFLQGHFERKGINIG